VILTIIFHAGIAQIVRRSIGVNIFITNIIDMIMQKVSVEEIFFQVIISEVILMGVQEVCIEVQARSLIFQIFISWGNLELILDLASFNILNDWFF